MALTETELGTTKEFFKKFNITKGFTQEQQAALMRHLILELGIEVDDQQSKDIFRICYALGNASAARQKFEKAKLLEVSEKSRGKDANDLADKWAV